jgi:hypothetical protein
VAAVTEFVIHRTGWYRVSWSGRFVDGRQWHQEWFELAAIPDCGGEEILELEVDTDR